MVHRKNNGVALDSPNMRALLAFLARPLEHLEAHQRDEPTNPLLQLDKIGAENQSVYTSELHTEGRLRLRAALDKISGAVSRIETETKDGHVISKPKLRRYGEAITKALDDIDLTLEIYIGREQKDSFNYDIAHPNHGRGELHRKMFEGVETLEALVSTQARFLQDYIANQVADKGKSMG